MSAKVIKTHDHGRSALFGLCFGHGNLDGSLVFSCMQIYCLGQAIPPMCVGIWTSITHESRQYKQVASRIGPRRPCVVAPLGSPNYRGNRIAFFPRCIKLNYPLGLLGLPPGSIR
jgi:hypothetical protein